MPSAKITSKGQLTLPVKVRLAMGVDTGDRVEFVPHENGTFLVIPANRSIKELKGKFRGRRSQPATIEEMNAAIARRAAQSR